MSGYRECDHVAPVAGRRTVFAAVEYPVDDPPITIVIHGEAFTRVLHAKRVYYADGPVGHTTCSHCDGYVDGRDAWCRHCGACLDE